MRGWLWVAFVLHLAGLVACTTTSSGVRRAAKYAAKSSKPKAPPVDDKSPFARAILLNGGQSPKANFYSHMMHLRQMRKVLLNRQMSDQRIDVFASDGSSNQPDLVVVDALPGQLKWLFRFRPESAFFEPVPRLINSVMKGKALRPSTKWALGRHFDELSRMLREAPVRLPEKQKPVFLFVTDHGTRNRSWSNQRNQKISMWRESMTVWEFHRLLQPLRQQRVVYVMSQCFSGSFFWSVFPRPGLLEAPRGNRCGFFSTLPNRYAYGCYAETQKEKGIGHAYRFIKAMKEASTLVEAHREVLLTDVTPDVPLRSSDGFLRAILEKEAKAKGTTLGTLASQIISRYGQQGDALISNEQQLIDAISKRFQVVRPRDIKEIKGRIKQQYKRMRFRQHVTKMWKKAYTSLRDSYLSKFYKTVPGLRKSLKQKYYKFLRERTGQKDVLNDADVVRLRKGFVAFMKKYPDVNKRLKLLEDKVAMSDKLAFWLKVQEAVLNRMAVLYYRMAGILYLHLSGRPLGMYKRGLKRLMECEATPIHQTKASASKASTKMPSLPPIKKDQSAGIPLILGIRYHPARHRSDPRLTPGAVKVRVVGMNSPAERAGLKPNDYIISANGQALASEYDLREQIMLHPSSKAPFKVRVLRQGKLLPLSINLQRMNTPEFVKMRPLEGRMISSLSPVKPLTGTTALPNVKKGTTLLFFWATWCGPCKFALPTLRRWHSKYASKGLRILAISKQKAEVVEKWYRSHPDAMPFSRSVDPRGALSTTLRIFVVPTLIVLRDGKVVKVHKGANKLKEVEQAFSTSLRP